MDRVALYVRAQFLTKRLVGNQIYRALQHVFQIKPRAEILLGCRRRIERNQNIHIAALMGLPARSRAKERQTAHAKLARELRLVRGQQG